MKFNKTIDELLAQMDNKNQDCAEEAGQDGGNAEYLENDEYVNFVMKELISGNVSLDANDATPPSSVAIQPPSAANPHQEANLVDHQVGVSSVTADSSTASAVHYNTAWPLTASYMSNGNQVVILTNPLPTPATPAGQTAAAAAAAPEATGSTSTGVPFAATFLEGKHVVVPGIIDQKPQNVIFATQAPMVSQPHTSNALVVAAANPQNMIIANPVGAAVATVAGQTIARSQTSDWTAAVPSAALATPASSKPADTESKKRKLYEEAEFQDPAMEKRRRNAQNAKNHRDKTKLRIQELTEELNQSRQETAESQAQVKRLEAEVDRLKKEKAQEEELTKEIQALKQENARLKAQEQAMVQQDKLGLQDFDLNQFFK